MNDILAGLLGEPLRASRLPGGNVSQVFRVTGPRGSAVLKRRGARFARIPELAPPPHATEDEADALRLFGSRAPGLLPRVLDVRPERRELVLSDLAPHREPGLAAAWRDGGPDGPGATSVGAALGRLHRTTAGVDRDLRRGGDAGFRRHWLGYVLGGRRHPALGGVARWVAANEPPLPVHGDFAPKNLVAAAGGLRVCDLDNAHRGSRLVEFGYALAHLFLHGAEHGADLPALCGAFTAGYLDGPEEPPWPAAVTAHAVAAAVSYRLDNRQVRYPVALDTAARERLSGAVGVVLDRRFDALADAAAVLAQAVERPARLRPGPPSLTTLRYRPHGDGVRLPTGARATASGLAVDQTAFAHRIRPGLVRPLPGAVVRARTHDLGGGRFTNVYDLVVDLARCQVVPLLSADAFPLRHAVGAATTAGGPAAGFTGTFEFISDDPAYQPAEHVLDLCCAGGVVRSLPTVTKPAAVLDGGTLRAVPVGAAGTLSVGGTRFTWSGSKDPRPADPGGSAGPADRAADRTPHAVVHGAANCRVRYREDHRTGFTRWVDPAEARTPEDAGRADVCVVAGQGGGRVREVRPGGGSDLFASSYVLSVPAAAAATVTAGDAVDVHTIGGVDPAGVSMCSLGPSLSAAAAGETGAWDASLGASPFAARTHARLLLAAAGDRLRVRLLDGAPLTSSFRGVSCAEARDLCAADGFDPDRTYHLDGGQTAKLAFGGPDGIRVLGNMHYLRWPETAGAPFRWIGEDGRGLHSAFVVTGRPA